MYRVSLTVESWTPFGSCVTAAFTSRLTPQYNTYKRMTLLAWPSFSMLVSDYFLQFVSTLFIFSYFNLICQLGSECWLTNEIIYLFVTSKRGKITVLLPHTFTAYLFCQIFCWSLNYFASFNPIIYLIWC